MRPPPRFTVENALHPLLSGAIGRRSRSGARWLPTDNLRMAKSTRRIRSWLASKNTRSAVVCRSALCRFDVPLQWTATMDRHNGRLQFAASKCRYNVPLQIVTYNMPMDRYNVPLK